MKKYLLILTTLLLVSCDNTAPTDKGDA